MKNGRKVSDLILLSISFLLLLFICTAPSPVSSAVIENAGKWAGVDEAVVEKIAADHGRKAAKPLINTDRGDLLLFVFLLAGAAGGFVGGYYWRKLTEQRTDSTKEVRSA
jgi:hypothetical protein